MSSADQSEVLIAEDDFEWQEIMAIDADIKPVMWSLRRLREVFSSVQGWFAIHICLR